MIIRHIHSIHAPLRSDAFPAGYSDHVNQSEVSVVPAG